MPAYAYPNAHYSMDKYQMYQSFIDNFWVLYTYVITSQFVYLISS